MVPNKVKHNFFYRSVLEICNVWALYFFPATAIVLNIILKRHQPVFCLSDTESSCECKGALTRPEILNLTGSFSILYHKTQIAKTFNEFHDFIMWNSYYSYLQIQNVKLLPIWTFSQIIFSYLNLSHQCSFLYTPKTLKKSCSFMTFSGGIEI